MSDDVGESQKQAAAEVNERLRKIATKKCSFVEIAEVHRILHWLRYSNTGEDRIRPRQTAYNRTYKSKGGINKAMASDVMWMDTDRGGMGWVNLYQVRRSYH
jgi:hypothetical protein